MTDHHHKAPSLTALMFPSDPIPIPTTLAALTDAIDQGLDVLTNPDTIRDIADHAERLRVLHQLFLLIAGWQYCHRPGRHE